MSDNAAPQGNYAASTNPASTAEKLYALENDPNTEGFNVWSVFYAKTIYDAKIWAKIWIDGVPQFIERIGILDVDNVNFLARLTIDADY